MDTTIFVDLHVHKKMIAVAMVEARAPADVRFYGTIANTPEAIRSKLLKLGARVIVSVRRVKLAFTSSCPDREVFAMAARRLCA